MSLPFEDLQSREVDLNAQETILKRNESPEFKAVRSIGCGEHSTMRIKMGNNYFLIRKECVFKMAPTISESGPTRSKLRSVEPNWIPNSIHCIR